MSKRDSLTDLPEELPAPIEDGAADHLFGSRLPSLALESTAGTFVDLSSCTGRTVVYCYPLTGRPDADLPEGWDEMPGARGCTPQACSFRDHHAELAALGAQIYGLSTQSTDYQREAVERLHLPFSLLSDEELDFTQALSLPTMEVERMTLIKRLTLIVNEGGIEKVFYPVFPPDQNAGEVVEWLSRHP